MNIGRDYVAGNYVEGDYVEGQKHVHHDGSDADTA
jgi:hypothetical protein